jgi:hypothetical protein
MPSLCPPASRYCPLNGLNRKLNVTGAMGLRIQHPRTEPSRGGPGKAESGANEKFPAQML